jgi:hypothetical protein
VDDPEKISSTIKQLGDNGAGFGDGRDDRLTVQLVHRASSEMRKCRRARMRGNSLIAS